MAPADLGDAPDASRRRALRSRPHDDPLGDLRFRALLRERDWAALPAAIRRRFSKRLAGGSTASMPARSSKPR